MECNIEDLREVGIHLYDLSNSFAQIHHKLLVIDNKKAFIGTADPHRSVSLQYLDFIVEIEDELILKEIVKVFQADVEQKAPIDYSHPSLVWGPYLQREKLLNLITSAQELILMYQQDIQDDSIMLTLEQSLKNKVNICIIMTPYPFDKERKKDDNIPFQKRIIQAGGQIGLLSNPYVHAKAMLIDPKNPNTVKLYIGSVNFYPNSLDNNRELGIIIRDQEAFKIFSDTFEKDWAWADKMK